MYDAAQKGQLSFDDMLTAVEGSAGALDAVYADTLDAPDQLALAMQNVKVAAADAAGPLMEIAADVLTNVVIPALQNASAWVSEFMETAGPGISSVVSGVTSTFEAVKNAITNPVETAKNAVHNAIEKIKGYFDFEWSLPDLKLPHIVVGGYIDVPVLGSIPDPTQLRVDWYAKGAIFDGPRIIGVGEKGPEGVIPLSGTRVRPFAEAVASELDIDGGGGSYEFVLPVIIDGREVARASATYTREELRRLDRIDNRKAGLAW